MEELCGFIPGRGLSHEKCMESQQEEMGLKIEEKPDFNCSNCGSRRRNIQRVDEDEGKSITRNWKDRLECADCGADPTDLNGKEFFKVTAEMLRKLKGL